ncbi:MAG: D-alanyl-D-alanine carboxypeptidase, partial [Prevotella sp.]|nr:D-alanyl-D-alanine carboxypeptidase [Prevotella sp.]
MKKYIFSIIFLLSATILRAQSVDDGGEASTLNCFSLRSATVGSQLSIVNCQLSIRLDSLIKEARLLETTQLGLMVWDLTADSALYTYNHRQRMRPASTMKLLTAITALDLFGGNHQFTTELRYKGEVVGRTLVGDLVCVGSMDPTFDNGDMNYFVDQIRAVGIDTICGRIVADKSFKDTLLLGQGWCWDDDNPCLSALLVNRKDNFVQRLTTLLTDVGIVFVERETRNEERGTWNMENCQLSIINCQLEKVLTRMMKQSDNLYAEALFYHTALSIARPATQKNARTAVRQFIQRLGFDPAQFTVADGSGLSLYNYVSHELLTAFLRYAWRNDRIRRH